MGGVVAFKPFPFLAVFDRRGAVSCTISHDPLWPLSPPYERIKLSKALTSTAENLRLRPEQFYDDADIEVRTASQVVNVNPDKNEVELSVRGNIYFLICRTCLPT